MEMTAHVLLVLRLRVSGAISLFFCMSSWLVQWRLSLELYLAAINRDVKHFLDVWVM
jgi:hypothetical protein